MPRFGKRNKIAKEKSSPKTNNYPDSFLIRMFHPIKFVKWWRMKHRILKQDKNNQYEYVTFGYYVKQI